MSIAELPNRSGQQNNSSYNSAPEFERANASRSTPRRARLSIGLGRHASFRGGPEDTSAKSDTLTAGTPNANGEASSPYGSGGGPLRLNQPANGCQSWPK